MIWFKALKGLSLFLVLVGMRAWFETTHTLSMREVGGILVVIGVVGYVLARGALGFTRRAHAEIRQPLESSGVVPTGQPQERVISKPDADMIFAFKRRDWERHVHQVTAPEGWTFRLVPHDTGTALARFERSTGLGASVQPLFSDDQGPPEMLIVSSYYPLSVLRITDQVLKRIQEGARLDLGPSYSVLANHAKMSDANLEGIELIVTREGTRGPNGTTR
jgi:hypothetical protein